MTALSPLPSAALPAGVRSRFIDGINGAPTITPGGNTLSNVTVSGFTVQNANFEGILALNASNVTLWANRVKGNDRALEIGKGQCPGIPDFETNEGDDCGEGIHLMGVDHTTIANNTVQGNSGGILLSDETLATHDNLISGNTVSNNPYDCGITMASHPPAPGSGWACQSCPCGASPTHPPRAS